MVVAVEVVAVEEVAAAAAVDSAEADVAALRAYQWMPIAGPAVLASA